MYHHQRSKTHTVLWIRSTGRVIQGHCIAGVLLVCAVISGFDVFKENLSTRNPENKLHFWSLRLQVLRLVHFQDHACINVIHHPNCELEVKRM
jgi:hypothetical protein